MALNEQQTQQNQLAMTEQAGQTKVIDHQLAIQRRKMSIRDIWRNGTDNNKHGTNQCIFTHQTLR